MKRYVKAILILLIICFMLHCAPSYCSQGDLTVTSYENSRGYIVVDAQINTDEPFTEVLLCVTYDAKLALVWYDTDENCHGAEVNYDNDEFVYFCLTQKQPTEKSALYAYFSPTEELVKGSLLVFNVKAYVKFNGSDELTELSCDDDDCIYVKGIYHVLLGDVNGDGRINTADAVVVLSACAGKITLSEPQEKAADFNNDNKINTADAKAILYFVVQN